MPAITRYGKENTSSENNSDTTTVLTMSSTASNGSETSSQTARVSNPQLQRLQASLDSVLAIVTDNSATMTTITDDIHIIKDDIVQIKDVTNEADGVKEQLHTTQGKVSRLELKNSNLEEKIISLESRLYEKDLIFYNVEETPNETTTDLKQSLYTVMTAMMMIPDTLLFNRNNPCGEVRFDTVTRIGRFQQDRKRPILVSFTSKSGRNIVQSRTYTSNLKTPIRVRVAEHFPTITKERRHVQIKNHLTQLRTAHHDTNNKITLKQDKILLNGIENNTFAFQRNPLPSISPLSVSFDKLAHSDKITEKKSVFQAHALPVETETQAIAAKNAIFHSPELSQATHIIYAYKMGITEDTIQSGYSDDDEVEAGSMLMELLNSENRTNIFVCVTRIKNGPNIGAARFTHIKNCAKQLLNSDRLPEEPTFNNIIF